MGIGRLQPLLRYYERKNRVKMKFRADNLVGVCLLVTCIMAASGVTEVWSWNFLVGIVAVFSIAISVICAGFLIIFEHEQNTD